MDAVSGEQLAGDRLGLFSEAVAGGERPAAKPLPHPLALAVTGSCRPESRGVVLLVNAGTRHPARPGTGAGFGGRSRGHDVQLDRACSAYCKRIVELPAMQEWIRAAKQEPEEIDELDAEF